MRLTEAELRNFAGAPPPHGKRLGSDNGRPAWVDLPPPSLADIAGNERVWRDAQMNATEWLITRHRDEQDMQKPSTLSDELFAELLAYRQNLRDWPTAAAFPDSSQRPVVPSWLPEIVL